MKVFFGFILPLNVLCANAAFTWTNCAPADAILQVSKVEVGPDPIVIPGDLQLTIEGSSSAPLTSSSLHISIKRKVAILGEISIPCLGNIGSCTYHEMCKIVGQMIGEDWMGVGVKIGTEIRTLLNHSGIDDSQCTQPARNIVIDHQTVHIPEIPSTLSHFAAGDYHLHMWLTDNVSGKVNLCIDARFTMTEKEPCTGIFCIFGKK